jgi:hypothetical protein
MDEKTLTRVFEADVMALPPLRLVLGDVPAPDPEIKHGQRPRQHSECLRPAEMTATVRRLITHLEEKQ